MDLLDVAYASRRAQMPPGSTTADITRDFFVDLSQAVQRRPWQQGTGNARTNSQFYAFECDTTLSGCSNLQLMGWPRDYCPSFQFSEGELRNLAGESYSVPWITALHFAMYMNPWGPWWATIP